MNKSILVNIGKNCIRILGVLILILAGLGSVEVPTVQAQSPIIMVRPNRDWVDGWDWISGETITLSIDDPDNGSGVDYSSSEEITDTSFSFRIGDVYDIEPGDVVSVYGNMSDITKEHVVTHVSITQVDLNSQTIFGIASPNVRVDVSVNYDPQCLITVISDGIGEWEADFTGLCDLNPGDELQAREWEDDGDSTMIDDSLFIPSIFVGLHGNYIEVEIWPDVTTLTLSIDDPTNGPGEDYSAQIIVDQGEDEYVFALGDQFQLQPGHIVTVSGAPFEITHIVKDPQVTSIDFEEDIVSGTCSPGATVRVQLDRIGGTWVTVDSNGNWSADFSVFGPTSDLTPASRMLVTCRLRREPGITEIKLPINSSTFLHGDVSGNNWTIGQPVILEIDDPGTLASPDFVDQAWPEPGPWLTTEVYFSVKEAIDIQTGFLVTMTQGSQVKTQVVTGIDITDVNLEADTVSGTAAANAYITVIAGYGYEQGRTVQADIAGNWTVDFSIPSDVPYEEIIDITIDTNISAHEWDDQSNSTGVVWEPVQETIEELDTILTDPELDPDVADEIEDALADLEGNNDGQGNNGAIDKFEDGQWNAALVKIKKAIQDLEDAEAVDPALDLSDVKELLALKAKSVALNVIEQAQAVASSPADWQKIDQAIALISEGDTLLDASDYLGAVDKFRDALGKAQSVL